MLLFSEQDFAAISHDSLDASSLVMVTLRQATSASPDRAADRFLVEMGACGWSRPLSCRSCVDLNAFRGDARQSLRRCRGFALCRRPLKFLSRCEAQVLF